MRSNIEAFSLVDHGTVPAPYVENVECPHCKQLNPKGQDNCNGCGKILITNA